MERMPSESFAPFAMLRDHFSVSKLRHSCEDDSRMLLKSSEFDVNQLSSIYLAVNFTSIDSLLFLSV